MIAVTLDTSAYSAFMKASSAPSPRTRSGTQRPEPVGLDLYAISDYHDHDDQDEQPAMLLNIEGLFGGAATMAVPVAEAKRRFSDLLKRVAYGGETVTIGSRGKPEAALVSVVELTHLRALERDHDARLLEETVRTSTGTVAIRDVLQTRDTTRSPEHVRAIPPAKRQGRIGAKRVSRARR